MVAKSQTFVEFVATHIQEVGFKMHGLDSRVAADSETKVTAARPMPLERGNIELVNETVASVELK